MLNPLHIVCGLKNKYERGLTMFELNFNINCKLALPKQKDLKKFFKPFLPYVPIVWLLAEAAKLI